MTHEDSIRMAHKAGEDIIRIAHAVGLCDEVGGIEGDTGSYYSYTEEIISLFLAAFKAGADTEREECAKLCDGLTAGHSYDFDLGRLHSAKVIRERTAK